MSASREWPAKVRWFERGSQVVPQLRNGLVKWDGKKNCLQLSLKSGPGISYAKEALFLPSIRPFYTTLSLTARTASDKSVDEVTIQFSDREAMIEAYDFLKNFLAVKSPYDRLPSKSRGLYQNTTPLRHTPSLAVGQTTPKSSLLTSCGRRKPIQSFDEAGQSQMEKVELMPSEKPGRIVVTEKADEAKLHEEFRTSSMSNDFADESSLYHTPCSTKRDSNQQKSQRMIRPTLTEIARQGQSKMRKHKVMPAEQLSSPPSTGFRRRISDVNEALLCSSQSPVKSTVKKSSLVLPLSPKQEPRNHGGFANLGATCYMNAVLQAILNVETFAKELFKTWQRCKKISEKNGISVQGIELISALSILASHRLLATEVQNKRLLKGVMGAVRSSTFSESRQEDAQEFMAQVFDQLSDECETVSREFPIKENNGQVAQNFVESNFMFALQNDIICESCGHTDTRCEESTSLPIDFEQSYFRSTDLRKKKIVSLQTMLDYCLRNEQVEHRCDVCGSVNAEIRRKFRKLPRCLVMYLKRYTLDAEKRTDSVDIPRFVTLDGHCAPLVEPFTQLPPSTEKGELFSLSPLQGGEQRSPQMQQTPQCRESYAEVKNNAAQNSRQSVADDKLGSLSGNRRSAEPSWRRSHRKSNAIPRRLWSAAREDSADLAHAGAVDKESSNVDVNKSSDLEMLSSPLKRPCDFASSVSSLSKLLAMNNDIRGNGEADDLFSPAVKRERAEPTRSTVSSSVTVSESRSFSNGCEQRPASSPTHVSTISLREKPFTSEELAVMSESEQMKAAIELSVSEHETTAKEKKIVDKQQISGNALAVKQLMEGNQSIKSALEGNENFCGTNDSSTITAFAGNIREDRPLNCSNGASIVPVLENGVEFENNHIRTVRYRPVTHAWRAKACAHFGLTLVDAPPEEEPAEMEMSFNDRPKRVATVAGDGNCLFRAVAYAITGGSEEGHAIIKEAVLSFELRHESCFRELANLSEEEWRDRMEQLMEDGSWGGTYEIIALATMLRIEIWTFLDGRWLCHRPWFRPSPDGTIQEIPYHEYQFGVRRAIYLTNENYHYNPVIEPSNACLLIERAHNERVQAVIANAETGEMEPSYRLISIVSHHGLTCSSGHYVCDVWKRKEHRWLHCDDSSVSSISEEDVRASQTKTGYLFFYLAAELLEMSTGDANAR